LESELDAKKKLVEQFQEAAKKATKQKEKLSDKHALREKIEQDTSTRIARLHDKLSCCNLKLKEKFEKIIPNNEVGY